MSIHKIWKSVEGGLGVGVASACCKVGHNLGSFENTRNRRRTKICQFDPTFRDVQYSDFEFGTVFGSRRVKKRYSVWL